MRRGHPANKIEITQVSIHAPAGGATGVRTRGDHRAGVSIHAPAGGATAVSLSTPCLQGVSIHAPAGGATGGAVQYRGFLGCFNPRTRGGCDGHSGCASSAIFWFQSTHPRGVRRPGGYAILGRLPVSIHAPAGGATRRSHPWRSSGRSFNPRTRGGCDLLLTLVHYASSLFQSTHPRGVRPQ